MAERDRSRTAHRPQPAETVDGGEEVEGHEETMEGPVGVGTQEGDTDADGNKMEPIKQSQELLDRAQLTEIAEVPEGFERVEDGSLRALDAPPDPTLARMQGGVGPVSATGGDPPVCTVCGDAATSVAGGGAANEIFYCAVHQGQSSEFTRPLAPA